MREREREGENIENLAIVFMYILLQYSKAILCFVQRERGRKRD